MVPNICSFFKKNILTGVGFQDSKHSDSIILLSRTVSPQCDKEERKPRETRRRENTPMFGGLF